MPKTHEVEQGDYLALIADKYGFSSWEDIWEHPKNAELRSRRPNPNVLYPGDSLFIPDNRVKEESCAVDQVHLFKVKRATTFLRLIIKDDEGHPFSNVDYTLRVASAKFKGKTDGNGQLEHKIPVGAQTADLTLDKIGLVWNLKIGHLDPIEERIENKELISGIQARLNNLSYHCGAVDGIAGPKTKEAIRRFQARVLKHENPSGEPDAETRAALMKEHLS